VKMPPCKNKWNTELTIPKDSVFRGIRFLQSQMWYVFFYSDEFLGGGFADR